MFNKKPEPQPEPKPHLYATCREVTTLLDMALRVMGRCEVDPSNRLALVLWDQLHAAQALADRIGYGQAPRA